MPAHVCSKHSTAADLAELEASDGELKEQASLKACFASSFSLPMRIPRFCRPALLHVANYPSLRVCLRLNQRAANQGLQNELADIWLRQVYRIAWASTVSAATPDLMQGLLRLLTLTDAVQQTWQIGAVA